MTGILEEISDAVTSFKVDKTIELSRKALIQGVDPLDVIDKGLVKGLKLVGRKFEQGEYFLVHITVAAEAARRAISDVLQPEILKRKVRRRSLGRVVIGTVEGDIHDIGKKLVAAMLFAEGFDVYDLGVDTPVERFVEKAREVDADIVGASALLSTTFPNQRRLIEALKSAGLRDKIKVMVGGAPVTEEWAKEIGADGYAPDAVEAAALAKKLLKARKKMRCFD